MRFRQERQSAARNSIIWLLLAWLDNYGVRLSDVGVVNLLGFQLQVSLQTRSMKNRAATALPGRVRAARRQTCDSANASTNTCSLASACDCADARAGHRRGRDCFRVLALAAGASDFPSESVLGFAGSVLRGSAFRSTV